MSEKSDTLQAWRTSWQPGEITWREGWEAQIDERRLEREQLKKARRSDRVTHGAALWGTDPEKLRTISDAAKLKPAGLPILGREADLAAWLGISLGRLRWFTRDQQVDESWHYTRYSIAKRSGGQRVILAPKRDLKAIQRKILHEILNHAAVTEQAHGFVTGRSIVSNAQPHAGHAYVANLDLKDFFPGISFRRVRSIFISLGYGFGVASSLALLCTERDRKPLVRRNKRIYVSLGERGLVQGAPTSPALANLAARRLDARLAGLAHKYNVTYTRYADDLTFSGDDEQGVRYVMNSAPRIIKDEGFTIHPDKTRFYRRSSRQVVTGLVVNDRVNTPRELRRSVRAILHNAAKTGLQAQNHQNRQDFRAYLQGLIGHIYQANPEHGRKLLAELQAIPD